MILALALAAEIGLNAPDSLKPCPRPKVEKQAGRGLYTHIRRLPVCEGPIGPLSSFAEMSEPVEYLPEQEKIAAAPEPTMGSDTGTDAEPEATPYSSVAGAAAFIPDMGMNQPNPGIYVSPAPEPEVFYLLAAGLGAIAWRSKHGR